MNPRPTQRRDAAFPAYNVEGLSLAASPRPCHETDDEGSSEGRPASSPPVQSLTEEDADTLPRFRWEAKLMADPTAGSNVRLRARPRLKQLPRRRPDQAQRHPDAAPVGFTRSHDFVDPSAVASDMGNLASRVRALMALQQQQVLQLPLGGRFFDIVLTASGPQAYAVMAVMDNIQHSGEESADACGPVIEDPQQSWLIWLVPPGTSEQWAPHRYATCLGRPYHVALPAITATEPPGPYWRRPCRSDRLVPPASLRQMLDQFQPGPAPHEALLGSMLSTIS